MHASSKGRIIAWTVLIGFGLANIAGYAFDLYHRFWWFDRALHSGTIFAITLWLALFVFARAIGGSRTGLAVLLVASVGLAIGALWEVAEWAFDQLAPGDVIKGKYDTVIDIIMDAIGSVLAGIATLSLTQPSGTSTAPQSETREAQPGG